MSARIGLYVRVSTEDQSLERQINSTTDYAERQFDADPADLDVYRDKSTGRDIDRSGYQNMMDDAERGDLDVVVVHSVTRLCRSTADLDRTATRLVDAGVGLHLVSEGLQITGEDDPFQRALFRLLGVFAELESDMNAVRTKEGIAARRASDEEYHHGRAPVGYTKDGNGGLVETDDYSRVCAVLDMVAKDEMSKREAAKRLDTSRPSIYRALDKPALYGL